MDGVFEGYGKDLASVKYDTPDYNKLVHLEKNVYQFSGAKNWQMLKELTMSLKDGDRMLSFKEFKNKAITILDEYNGRNLRNEYNAAVAGSQMASKWVDIEKAAKINPKGAAGVLLEYRTMEDSQVRASHQLLNRIIRPANDDFWKTYYPPNGWNCRCTVVRLNTGKQTTDKDLKDKTAAVTPQKGFTANLAEGGFVFPANSAYYVGLPDNVENAHLRIQRKVMKDWAKDNIAGKSYTSKIGDITITRTGIDKILTQPHDLVFEKNLVLYKIQDVIKSAKLVESVPDAKGKVKTMHYLSINMEGKKNYLVVKELLNGEKHLYTIQDNNKGAKKKNG